MGNIERIEQMLVRSVARLGPWVAPIPSAFFVARSATERLAVPPAMAGVIAGVIELLGLTTVWCALRFIAWNGLARTPSGNLRQGYSLAPTPIALVLILAYLITTIGLTVLLGVFPHLAIYAPAVFPSLTVIGAANLALLDHQARREQAAQQAREERRARRAQQKLRPAASGVHSKSKPEISPELPEISPGVSGGRSKNKPEVSQGLPEIPRALRERIPQIIALYSKNPRASLGTLAETLGLSSSRASELRGLAINFGILERSGPREFRVNGRMQN